MMNAKSGKGVIPRLTIVECAVVGQCEVCCEAKMGRSRHKHVSESSERCKKMDGVHLDQVGLLWCRTININRYFSFAYRFSSCEFPFFKASNESYSEI